MSGELALALVCDECRQNRVQGDVIVRKQKPAEQVRVLLSDNQ
jgi:hypothetical protein